MAARGAFSSCASTDMNWKRTLRLSSSNILALRRAMRWPTAFRTDAFSSAGVNGFERKSNAPFFVAVTAASIEAYAVIMMMRISVFRSDSHASTSSPVMPGSLWSRSIRSGFSLSSFRTASSPEAACIRSKETIVRISSTDTVNPVRARATAVLMPGSSSTMRIFSFSKDAAARPGSGVGSPSGSSGI